MLNKGSEEGKRKIIEKEENIQIGKGGEFSSFSCLVLLPFYWSPVP